MQDHILLDEQSFERHLIPFRDLLFSAYTGSDFVLNVDNKRLKAKILYHYTTAPTDDSGICIFNGEWNDPCFLPYFSTTKSREKWVGSRVLC